MNVHAHAHELKTIFRRLLVLLFSCGLLFLVSCSQKEGGDMENMNDSNHVRIMAASDLHYLSKQLYDPQSAVFEKLMSTNDGKLAEKTDEILDALKAAALKEKPDVLVLCGDLTFNGELVSLNEVAESLKGVEEAGIPVLVTTGNHDIAYRMAMTYFGDEPEYTQSISSNTFADVMSEYGYKDALYRDETSLSYMYAINDSCWMLVLDANSTEYPCAIGGDTLVWMDEVLSKADEAGASVIVMSHQNILIQSQMMYMGYVLNNHDAVENILRSHGVFLCLSGHSHLQHTAVKDGMSDVCNESVSIWPLQYGMFDVDLSKRTFAHELTSLGIYQEEAFEVFTQTLLRMTSANVKEAVDDPVLQKEMTDYAIAMNAAYFSGNAQKVRELAAQKGRELWETFGASSFWSLYMKNIIEEYCAE